MICLFLSYCFDMISFLVCAVDWMSSISDLHSHAWSPNRHAPMPEDQLTPLHLSCSWWGRPHAGYGALESIDKSEVNIFDSNVFATKKDRGSRNSRRYTIKGNRKQFADERLHRSVANGCSCGRYQKLYIKLNEDRGVMAHYGECKKRVDKIYFISF